jgi:hypothetical protein
MEHLFSDPDILFASLNGYGIKSINIVKDYNKNPIFTRPWQATNIPLIDYITSYFDHEYPLLGSDFIEPVNSRFTTLNFMGKKEKEPMMYYSSHNGTDFKLPYGTDILATDSGVARIFLLPRLREYYSYRSFNRLSNSIHALTIGGISNQNRTNCSYKRTSNWKSRNDW